MWWRRWSLTCCCCELRLPVVLGHARAQRRRFVGYRVPENSRIGGAGAFAVGKFSGPLLEAAVLLTPTQTNGDSLPSRRASRNVPAMWEYEGVDENGIDLLARRVRSVDLRRP